MSSTFREMQGFLHRSVGHPRFWGIFLMMVVLFAIIGPFGTYDRIGFVQRLIYWSVTMIGSWAIAIVTISIFVGLFHSRWPNHIALLILGAFFASFPIAAFLRISIAWFIELPAELGYFNLLVTAAPISIAFGVLVYFAISDTFVSPEPTADQSNILLDRLAVEKRGPVQHMSMQDHYVSVTTSRGVDLVLMRMADAVAALSADDGLQIHRSHWVSKSAISHSRRENGQPIVVMSDGTELPVSRSFAKAAREAGII